MGLSFESLTLPKDNFAEITVIGTGGGYGESCIIHLGNQNWIVIDSCIDNKTNESLPLKYLRNIGVDVETQVKLILCTHWHDDHIMGISELFESCKSAKFAFARANDLDKFLYFVTLDYQKVKRKSSNSSTKEFMKCLEINSERNSTILSPKSDTMLLNLIDQGIECEVYSLSPSDYTLHLFDYEISSLITEYGPPQKRAVYRSPNSKSVVVLLKLGKHNALLGSDLEVIIDNDKEGWLNILNHSQVIKKIKSSLYKVSHHGSSNGYHDRIWAELLLSNPVSALTPYNRGWKLPEADVLNKMCIDTDKLYMTSKFGNQNSKKRDKEIEKMLKDFNIKLTEVKYQFGLVQCRVDMNDESSKWNVLTIGEAFHVNNTFDRG